MRPAGKEGPAPRGPLPYAGAIVPSLFVSRLRLPALHPLLVDPVRRASLPLVAATAAVLDLPTLSFAATISPVHAAMVLVAFMVTTFGTLAVASLIGYSPTRLQQFFEERHLGADPRGVEIDRRDSEYLVVAFLIAALGWLLGPLSLVRAIDPTHHVWALSVFVLVQVLFGCTLPAAIAQRRPERVLLAVLPVLRPVWILVRWPLVAPMLACKRLALRALRLDRTGADTTFDVQKQVVAAVADTVTESNSTLLPEERTWIGNIVGLKDQQVSAVMTPRHEVIALAESMPLRAALEKALEHGFSRYPVYRDRIDLVFGVFHVKDALPLLLAPSDALAGKTLAAVVREPLFVPETTEVVTLLRRFQASHQHLAIAIDEYGTTVGVVTVEDVLEEIVGDIGDEYDSPPNTQPTSSDEVKVIESGRVVEFSGRTKVTTLNERLGCELPVDGGWETVAGMVIAKLAHIPKTGESVVVDGVEVRVLQADARRVHRLRATVLAPAPAKAED